MFSDFFFRINTDQGTIEDDFPFSKVGYVSSLQICLYIIYILYTYMGDCGGRSHLNHHESSPLLRDVETCCNTFVPFV